MGEKSFDRRRPAIEVKNVSKSFRIYSDKGTQLKDKLLFWKRNRFEVHEVLKNLSFEVYRGEAVGLIGHNGCGKSTTLKMLTRIMYPDSGTIAVDGRVSALIELGAGFHPDMSGRENIYTNAAIFGLSRREVDERLDDIIAFSELGEFIDNPVRTYSSGMYMRLAFSVAINVDADILFVDEILAVGDASFQSKCISKLKDIKASGATIVIVSHDLAQIENLCDRSIWINDGGIAMQGTPDEVHKAYLKYMFDRADAVQDETEKKAAETPPDMRDYKAFIRKVTVLDSDNRPCRSFARGSEIRVRVDYTARERLDEPILGVGFFRADNFYCYGTNTAIDGVRTGQPQGEHSYIFRISDCPLMPGYYNVDAAISREMGIDYHYSRSAASFSVVSDVHDAGNVYLPHSWELD